MNEEIDPETMVTTVNAQLDALYHLAEVLGEMADGMSSDVWTSWSCMEVEAVAQVLISVGQPQIATQILTIHAAGDDGGDRHCSGAYELATQGAAQPQPYHFVRLVKIEDGEKVNFALPAGPFYDGDNADAGPCVGCSELVEFELPTGYRRLVISGEILS